MSQEIDVPGVIAMLEDITSTIGPEVRTMRRKPALGGVFGHSGFSLASLPFIEDRLNDVRYFVLHDCGLVLSMARSRAEALAMARKVLAAFDKLTLDGLFAKYQAKKDAAEAEARRQRAEAEAELFALRRSQRSAQRVGSIPRRRQRIYDESEGKCHYCGTALTLDGKWHIEHKMPKALGGGNEPGNLVASCVTCNHKKRDTTDVEFKARLAKEKAA